MTALLRVHSTAAEFGEENPMTKQARSDAKKIFALPNDQWYCYDVGTVEHDHIRLMRRRDPRTYDIPVRSGQFALAKIITAPDDYTEGGPAAEFRLLTPNRGKDKQKPARVNDSGLYLALSEQMLREHVIIIDHPEAAALVNDDLDPDLALHPHDLTNAIRRILVEGALTS